MTNGHKNSILFAYADWCRLKGFKYTPQKYKREEKLPYIPTEAELDALISGCGGRLRPFLQLLKESAFRPSEAMRLTPVDFDLNQQTCILNKPSKNSRPRQFKMSDKLTSMIIPYIRKTPQDSRIFRGRIKTIRRNFSRRRTVLAEKLANPRLTRINFKTFRHWKATMTYHKTKDILYVQRLLGHKSLKNTLVYTHLVDFGTDDSFTVKIASYIAEFTAFLEQGFEYVSDYGDAKVLRKRK